MVKLLKRSVRMRNKLMLFDSKNILLIDDRQDNIDMAKEFGWNAFKTTGLELEKIIECCNKFIMGSD